MKNKVSFLDSVADNLPKHSQKDLLIVKRKTEYEVWTLKDFKAGSLMLAPVSSEIKQRFWTAGRAAIVKDTFKDNPMVIDGRIRAAFDSKCSFGLFWLVTREKTDKAKNINMEIQYVKAKRTLELEMLDNTIAKIEGDSEQPSIPVVVNKEKVKKHTRLVAGIDTALKRLHEKLEREKEKRNQKDKKTEKTEEDAEPKAKKAKSSKED